MVFFLLGEACLSRSTSFLFFLRGITVLQNPFSPVIDFYIFPRVSDLAHGGLSSQWAPFPQISFLFFQRNTGWYALQDLAFNNHFRYFISFFSKENVSSVFLHAKETFSPPPPPLFNVFSEILQLFLSPSIAAQKMSPQEHDRKLP